jgi:hypothetical protein
MMNEWLKAQAQKQQLTERSFQQKRLGMAITEQLTPKEEKFAKANRHILSEMVKRYGSDKGTQLFYSSVREQVKKINEETSTSRGEPYGEPPIERPKFRNVNPPPAPPLSRDPRNDIPPPAQPLSTSQDDFNAVPTSQNERNTPGGVGVPSDIPMPYTSGRNTSSRNTSNRKESNKNDLIATNRHCAGLEESQTCTARQFALSALSERRVFLEGWSYTTCPLTEPILNKYWKEDSWRVNQDFFLTPNNENFEVLRNSGVDWLVVDSTRPSVSSYEPFAELVKTSGSVSLWKVKDQYLGEVLKQSDPCGSKSIQITS